MILNTLGYRGVANDAAPRKGIDLDFKHETMVGVRCLVLGAGGFLGGAVCAALKNQGAVVHAYGRSLSAATKSTDATMWSERRIEDDRALSTALQGQEVVFHLVGGSLPEASNRDPAGDVLTQIIPSILLLELCRGAQVRKVVFASSGGTVYGIPSVVPTPEGANTKPITAYGVNKLTVENYLEVFRYLYGLNYHVLRIANPYGPGQSPFKGQGVVATILHRALSGLPIELWGTGDVTRDFIYVDDVANALIMAAQYDGPHRTMNVGSGVGCSLNQLIIEIQDVLGCRALEVVRKGGRMADVPVSVLDTTLIRSVTGWRPQISRLDGLAATAEWVRATYR